MNEKWMNAFIHESFIFMNELERIFERSMNEPFMGKSVDKVKTTWQTYTLILFWCLLSEVTREVFDLIVAFWNSVKTDR